MEAKSITKESFGEWMNMARRFERLGNLPQAADCARSAKDVAQKFPDLVCEGRPLPAPLADQLDRLCALCA